MRALHILRRHVRARLEVVHDADGSDLQDTVVPDQAPFAVRTQVVTNRRLPRGVSRPARVPVVHATAAPMR
ncbi:MAG: hypothetical protein JWR62_1796 [Modestobacter sp.]|jgi:hypothetical protein|nr:hypothetical protein [Modestobacter sp.]